MSKHSSTPQDDLTLDADAPELSLRCNLSGQTDVAAIIGVGSSGGSDISVARPAATADAVAELRGVHE